MKKYKVTVSFRPHASSLHREHVTYAISARNRQVALFRAGWAMREDGRYYIPDSLEVEVNPA
jgi:hypothetical protein